MGVAQLDRASGYGPEGREFESSRPRCKDLHKQVLFNFIGNSVPMKLKRLRKDRTEDNWELNKGIAFHIKKTDYQPIQTYDLRTAGFSRGKTGFDFIRCWSPEWRKFSVLLSNQSKERYSYLIYYGTWFRGRCAERIRIESPAMKVKGKGADGRNSRISRFFLWVKDRGNEGSEKSTRQ